MPLWAEAIIALLSTVGFYALLYGVYELFFGKKKEVLYVYFSEEKLCENVQDIVICTNDSFEADRILSALEKEYGKIYILKGSEKWRTDKMKETESKERLKK